jgi:hypothetical protein
VFVYRVFVYRVFRPPDRRLTEELELRGADHAVEFE